MQLFQDFNNEEFDVSKLLFDILQSPAEKQIQKLNSNSLTTNRQDTDVVMQEPYMPRVSDSDRENIPC